MFVIRRYLLLLLREGISCLYSLLCNLVFLLPVTKYKHVTAIFKTFCIVVYFLIFFFFVLFFKVCNFCYSFSPCGNTCVHYGEFHWAPSKFTMDNQLVQGKGKSGGGEHLF